MFDRKAVFTFLIITFGITYLVEGAMILSGFRVAQIPAFGGQIAVALVMWAPAVAALLTIRFVSHEKVGSIGGGFTGLIGIAVVLLAGLATMQWFNRGAARQAAVQASVTN